MSILRALERRMRPFERRGQAAGIVNVNFVPPEVQIRLLARDRAGRWGAVVGITAVGLLLGTLGARGGDNAAQQLRVLLAGERERIRIEEKAAARLEAQAAVVRRQVGELSVQRASLSWSGVLRELGELTPPGVTLRRLELVYKEPTKPPAPPAPEPGKVVAASVAPPAPSPGAVEIRIEGLAAEYAAIVRMHDRLRQSGAFERVTLMRSGLERVGSRELFAFALSARRSR
jgi:Tfp pilus assembly protein PilN